MTEKLSDKQAYEIECTGDENALVALAELRALRARETYLREWITECDRMVIELRDENAKLVAALDDCYRLLSTIRNPVIDSDYYVVANAAEALASVKGGAR